MKPIKVLFADTSSAPQHIGRDDDGQLTDVLVHVTKVGGVVTLNPVDTRTVRDSFNRAMDSRSWDVDVLRSVVLWQRRTIDFQAIHTAFLLDAITEDEFEEESSKFVVDLKNLDPRFIAMMIKRVDFLVGLQFDTSDYADFFQCSQENVMDGLKLLPAERYSEMLPQSSGN